MPIDVWFWGISISVLFALQPFFVANVRAQKFVQYCSLIAVSVSIMSSFLLITDSMGSVLALLSLWQGLNVVRYLEPRYSIDELRRRIRTTTLWLIPQIGLALLIYVSSVPELNEEFVERLLVGSLGFSLSLLVMIVITAIWSALHQRISSTPAIGADAPSVTLAIPARNETNSLSETLEKALKSSYPKLEILVLDDCSHDNTSEIIKGYAQKGVRFIQGAELTGGWLGKNRAYRLLAEEASGEIIIFSSADVHYDTESVSRLVSYMEYHKIDMVSVMPRRRQVNIFASLVQPIRYVVQLVWPKVIFGNQPVLSSCWAITSKALNDSSGFNPLKNQIAPEQLFANNQAAKNSYKFLISNPQLGISTRKTAKSQLNTAIRTIYPKFHQEMGFVLPLVTVAMLLFGVPYFVVVWSTFDPTPMPGASIALVIVIMMATVNLGYAFMNAPKAAAIYAINVPAVILAHIGAMIWSMMQYEFGEVNWKGRNVCLPVLEAKKPKENHASRHRHRRHRRS